jgi:hypothetical protein
MKAYVVIWPGTGATRFRFSGIVSAQSSSRHGSLIIRKGRAAVNGATGGGAIPGPVAVKDVAGKNPRKGTAKGCGHYQSTTRRQRLLAQRTHTNSLFGNKPRCSSNPVLGLGGIVPAPNLLFGRKTADDPKTNTTKRRTLFCQRASRCYAQYTAATTQRK